MDKGYKAALYARISVDDGNEESSSITNQKLLIEEYLRDNSIDIYDYYVDDGFSGGNFDRPEFQRMMGDIKAGLVNMVVTKDISRLGRDFVATGNYVYRVFPENNVRYVSILDNFDTFKPSISDDIIPFKAVLNDMYLSDTSRKIKLSRHELMKKGYFLGSTVPFGYKRSDYDSRVLVILDETASIVRKIFAYKKAGVSSRQIAKILTSENVMPPNVYNKRDIKMTLTTNIWKPSAVDYILKNEIYKGVLIQGKYDRVSLKSKKMKVTPNSSWIITEHPELAIIEKSLFDLVNNERKTSLVRNRKYDYLLKGLVRCHECGLTMLARMIKKNNKEYAIFCCQTYAKFGKSLCTMHYIKENVLNEIVIREIKDLYSRVDRDLFVSVCDAYLSNRESSEKVDKLAREIQILKDALSELYKDKVSGEISHGEYTSLREKFVKDLDELENTLKSKDQCRKSFNRENVINDFLNVVNYNQHILSYLIDCIRVYENKKISIVFKIKGD